jgi:hypothetical protein
MTFNVTTKTPPEIKWLLVERATLVGDIEQLERRRILLDAEIARLHSQVAALDASVRLVEGRVRPDAAGRVQRHRQNYGRRGALQAFLVQSLQGAADVGLSAREVTLLASAQFGLDFVSKAEFNNYLRNSVQPRLRELREKGQVENLASPGPDGMRWRWKRTTSTFADLARLVQGPAVVGSGGTVSEARGTQSWP